MYHHERMSDKFSSKWFSMLAGPPDEGLLIVPHTSCVCCLLRQGHQHHGKTPCYKFKHDATKLPVTLVFGDQILEQMQRSLASLRRDLIAHTPAVPLIKVIKYLLRQRALNGPQAKGKGQWGMPSTCDHCQRELCRGSPSRCSSASRSVHCFKDVVPYNRPHHDAYPKLPAGGALDAVQLLKKGSHGL